MNPTGDDLVPRRAEAARSPSRPAARAVDDLVPHRPQTERGWLVEGVVALLRGITWLSPLPVGRGRLLWVFRRPEGRWVSETYVALWVGALVACLVVADTSAGPWVVGVALFRYGDLVGAQAVVLADPVGLRIGDPRRTLVVAGLHIAEIALIVGAVYRWQLGQRLGAAFMSGFDAVILNGIQGQAGNWLDAARVLGAVGSAMVLLTAVAAVVRLARDR